jgi:hypothetical protein
MPQQLLAQQLFSKCSHFGGSAIQAQYAAHDSIESIHGGISTSLTLQAVKDRGTLKAWEVKACRQ